MSWNVLDFHGSSVGGNGSRRPVSPPPLFQPALERLEERAVPAVLSVLPIQVTAINIEGNTINVDANLFNQNITIPIDVGVTPATPSGPGGGGGGGSGHDCPILNLELNEINLDVLGLNVATSPICLDVEAERGQGKLLGNLLCGVAELLDQGSTLEEAIGSLNQNLQNRLIGGLTDLIGGVFDQFGQALTQTTGILTPDAEGDCEILNLEVGPLHLDVLGLNVDLYNCDDRDAPITVDIFGETGEGKLLGNLLCGLTGALDGLDLTDVQTDAILDNLLPILPTLSAVPL
jgi:hypothetical protein